jgi:hypothetical protein
MRHVAVVILLVGVGILGYVVIRRNNEAVARVRQERIAESLRRIDERLAHFDDRIRAERDPARIAAELSERVRYEEELRQRNPWMFPGR